MKLVSTFALSLILLLKPVAAFLPATCGSDGGGGSSTVEDCIETNQTGCMDVSDCCTSDCNQTSYQCRDMRCICCAGQEDEYCEQDQDCCFRCEREGIPFCNTFRQECDCTDRDYLRVLTESFDDRRLFELLQGDEEYELYYREYEEKKNHAIGSGLCLHPSSIHHEKTTTHNECFHIDNQVEMIDVEDLLVVGNNDYGALPRSFETDMYRPWIQPQASKDVPQVKTLATNPGIWQFDDFLSTDEIGLIRQLITKYGDEKGLFGPCRSETLQPDNAHPATGKQCFKISTENACPGPYQVSACDMPTDPEDAPLVESVLQRIQSLWPDVQMTPYIKFQVTDSDLSTPPVDLHRDNGKAISTLVFLTGGGAHNLFPNAGVELVPHAGRAFAWLNERSDGSSNPMAHHAVQAHPARLGKRIILLFESPSVLGGEFYKKELNDGYN